MKGKYFYLTSTSAKIARIRAVFAKVFPPLLWLRDVISRTELQQEATRHQDRGQKEEEKHCGKYCVAGVESDETKFFITLEGNRKDQG